MKRAVVAAVVACLAAACGRKGPPLPPLVRLPALPTDLAAARRGNTVDLTVTVPASNTDGTRPANISRIDIYALTAPASTSDTVVLKDGVRVASAQVKTPRDPNDTVDVDDPASDVEPPVGPGLDQGSTARLQEVLTPASIAPSRISPPPGRTAKDLAQERAGGPLIGPPPGAAVRLYLALGVNNRGRQGPVSRRVNVPLIPPPARADEPTIAYDESGITVSWEANAPVDAESAKADDVLPSRSLVSPAITIAYNVYETPAASAPGALDVKLTGTPVADRSFIDRRVEWGVERCYAVRAVEIVDGMTIEGDRSEPRCVTPVDSFAPAAPKKPTAIALAGAINILWDPSEEADLAGYLVFRGTSPGGPLTRLTPDPIERTNFTDEVPADFRAFYGIQAVDKAGNASAMSPFTDEETAR